jgi:hypothetical protein
MDGNYVNGSLRARYGVGARYQRKPVIASGGFIQIKFSSVLITDQSGQLTPGKLHLFKLVSCVPVSAKTSKKYTCQSLRLQYCTVLYSIQWRSRNLNFFLNVASVIRPRPRHAAVM